MSDELVFAEAGFTVQELQALGLTRDPFIPTNRDALYDGSGRARLLAKLTYFDRWTRPVMLVTGPAGSGRSSICRGMEQRLAGRAFVATLSGRELTSRQRFNRQVGERLEVPVEPGTAAVDPVARTLRATRERLNDDDVQSILMIDDAHLVDADVVAALIDLCLAADSAHGLSLILFADSDFADTLRVALHRDVVDEFWLELPLERIEAAEASRYLDMKLRGAGGHSGLLNRGDCRRIHARAQGNPARMNEVARGMLKRRVTNGSPLVWLRRPAVVAGAVAGVVLLIAGYLWISSGPDEPEAALTPAPGLALFEEPSAPVEAAGSSTANSENSGMPGGEVGAGNLAGSRGFADDNATEPVAAPETAQVEAQESARQPEPDPVAAVQQRTARELSLPDGSADGPLDVSRPTKPAEPPVPAQLPDPAPSLLRVPVDLPVSEAAGHAWVLRQNPDHWTVQVLGVSELASAQSFVTRYRGVFRIVQLRRPEGPWYVLVTEPYVYREHAVRARDGFPLEIQRGQPWVRQFSSLAGDLR